MYSTKEKKREYERLYRSRNREKFSLKSKRYREENKELVKKKKAEYFQKNKSRIQERWNKQVLRYRFGITPQQYDKMLADQGGVCKICKKFRLTKVQKRMGVDHCHKTGKLRGILCDWCNTGIAKFEDNESLLIEAIAYLKTNGNDINIGETVDTGKYSIGSKGGKKYWEVPCRNII